ncbi:hypothetical protein PSSHI_00970 [Photobacterium sp. R1]
MIAEKRTLCGIALESVNHSVFITNRLEQDHIFQLLKRVGILLWIQAALLAKNIGMKWKNSIVSDR